MAFDTAQYYERLLGDETRTLLAWFYQRNPGVVETAEGLAQRLGLRPERLDGALADHVELGLLARRSIGGHDVLLYDARRRKELDQAVADSLSTAGGAS
ncbi:MAG: hypothetical protein ACPGQL_09930 [Thermoplasmatota archaeon]